MLKRMAEINLQRNNTLLAKGISDILENDLKDNISGKTVKGYAEIKEGDLEKAEKIFAELSQEKENGEVLGKEGLATVYAKMGHTERAIELAEEVEKKAPDRSYANVVKADLFYAMGNYNSAEAEYNKAIQKNEFEPYQEAEAYHKASIFFAENGNSDLII